VRRLVELGDVRNGPVSGTWVVVASTSDTEESLLTPVGAPRVAADPVVYTVLSSPAIQLDGVVGDAVVAGVVHVDAAGVGFDALGVDVGTDWATGIDLGHDVVIAADGAVLRQSNLRIGLDFIASTVRIAVHAGVDCRALHVLRLVLLASDIRNAVLVNPRIGCVGISTATRSSSTAVKQCLDGWNQVTLSSVGGDLDAISD